MEVDGSDYFFFSTYELLFFSGELVVSVSKETTIL